MTRKIIYRSLSLANRKYTIYKTLPQNKSRSIIHETTFIKSPPSDYIKSRVFVNIFYVLVFENAVLVYETLF
jgi:hypothetical protein